MPPLLVEPRFLSLVESANYLGIAKNSLRRLIDAGKLTALRPVPGRVVLDRRALDAFVLAQTQAPGVRRGRPRKTVG